MNARNKLQCLSQTSLSGLLERGKAANRVQVVKESTVAWGGFDEHLSLVYAVYQSVTEFIIMIVMNLVTPKSAANKELLFNKLPFETT